MNVYEIEFRQEGQALSRDNYKVLAESLEGALEALKTQVKDDYGSEFRYELTAVKEIARGVVMAKSGRKSAKAA